MAQLRIRRLFSDFENARTPTAQRAYVRDEMVRLIQDGVFNLTEVMNQRPAVKQLCNDVIFGHGIDDGKMGHEKGTHITSFPIPQQIKNHQIMIESMRGDNIRYLDGSREVEGIIVGAQSRHEVPQIEENWVDLETTKAKLNLREAWLCLKFHGENVVHTVTQWEKDNIWKYREVKEQSTQKKHNKQEAEARA